MNESITPNDVPLVPDASMDGIPHLLTVTEASNALRISRWSLYQLINKRRLKTVRIDRRRLIAPADLRALVDELRAEGAHDG